MNNALRREDRGNREVRREGLGGIGEGIFEEVEMKGIGQQMEGLRKLRE